MPAGTLMPAGTADLSIDPRLARAPPSVRELRGAAPLTRRARARDAKEKLGAPFSFFHCPKWGASGPHTVAETREREPPPLTLTSIVGRFGGGSLSLKRPTRWGAVKGPVCSDGAAKAQSSGPLGGAVKGPVCSDGAAKEVFSLDARGGIILAAGPGLRLDAFEPRRRLASNPCWDVLRRQAGRWRSMSTRLHAAHIALVTSSGWTWPVGQ